MSAFPKVAHEIPRPFQDKIEVDQRIAEARKDNVVTFKQYKALAQEQAHLRFSCAAICKRK